MAKSKTNPEAIYMQLKALLLQQPEYGSPASPEKMQWLGRAAAIIEPLLDTFDHTEFKTAMDKYISYGSKSEDTLNNYWKIQTILYRALAKI